jgi:hypothetical protein
MDTLFYKGGDVKIQEYCDYLKKATSEGNQDFRRVTFIGTTNNIGRIDPDILAHFMFLNVSFYV